MMMLLRTLRLLEDTAVLEEKRKLQEALAREDAFSEKLYGLLLRLGPLLSLLWSRAAEAAHDETLPQVQRLEAKTAREELLNLMMISVVELYRRQGELATFLQIYSGKKHIFYEVQEKMLRSIIDELQELYAGTPRGLMLALESTMEVLERTFSRLSHSNSSASDELLEHFNRSKLRIAMHEGVFAGGLLSELLFTLTKKVQAPPELLEKAYSALELHGLIEGYSPLTAAQRRRLYTRELPLQRSRLHIYLVGHYADPTLV